VTDETLRVSEQEAGLRLDVFLSRRLPGISRSQLQKLIAAGNILINGAPAIKKRTMAGNDSVIVSHPEVDTSYSSPKAQNIPIDILYEDDFLMAVNKPAGLVVHPGHGVPDGTLVNALLYRGASLSSGGSSPHRPGIVHRLDKETSGVVLIAKTNPVHFRLAAEFANRAVAKQYLGICIGRPVEDKGSIDLALDRSRREPVKRAVSAHGKAATTHYETIIHRSGISVLRFFPRTGRTHQIRVHCSSAGFPIVADPLYGGDKERLLRINPAERPFAYKVYKCFQRHALHAQCISFTHPETGREVTIKAPIPDDFRNALHLFDDPEILRTLERT
jgi:23S rRNA pseudouridine1911/1915/1917 synthase